MIKNPGARLSGKPAKYAKPLVELLRGKLLLIAIPVIALCLGAAIYLLIERTISSAVRQNAADTSRAWANHFATNFVEMDAVLETGKLTGEQLQYIRNTEKLGHVFRFKLFDASGNLVLISDEADKTLTELSLRAHNAEAKRAIDLGEEIVFVEENHGMADRPQIFAEAYVPVKGPDGKLQAVVEVYVDQTSIKTLFKEAFVGLGLSLACLIAVAFLLPALAFAARNSQALRVAEKAAEAETALRVSAELHASDLAEMNNRISSLNREMVGSIRQLGNTQSELLRKGKLAQLGQLTATLAHDLRNPLAAVRTSAFLLQRKLKGKELGVDAELDRIKNSVVRCDGIITQLLDFARTKPLRTESLDLDTWVAQIMVSEAASFPPDVTVECKPGFTGGRVEFDPAGMSRVLIKLLRNASAALAANRSGTEKLATLRPRITVRTRRTARGAEISVSDNGPGIAEEMLGRIFDPLFTVKENGADLGLPAVQQIVERHGGGIDAASRPGEGAVFTAWWPLAATLKEAV